MPYPSLVHTAPCSSLLIGLLLIVAPPLAAHTVRPAVATVSFVSGGYSIAIETNAEALLAGIGPEHADTRDAPTARDYDRLRELEPEALQKRFDTFAPLFVARVRPLIDGKPAVIEFVGLDVAPVGDLDLARRSVIRLRGTLQRGAASFQWAWPAAYGNCALRLRYGDAPVVQSHWLRNGEPSPLFALDAAVVPRARLVVLQDYLTLGFTHILPLGFDHILFVVGLFLLSLQLAPILWQVTAFTVAHTLTLALTVYGVVALPTGIVEPLIALSIVYVGIENIVTPRLRPWRVALVFGFGLLHGMGFAGVLTGIGLPENEFLAALIGFNVGVEFGQLAVIGVALLAVGIFRHRTWYRARIVVPASATIALIGLYWTVERLT